VQSRIFPGGEDRLHVVGYQMCPRSKMTSSREGADISSRAARTMACMKRYYRIASAAALSIMKLYRRALKRIGRCHRGCCRSAGTPAGTRPEPM
jgi:hypothetical protein